MIDLDKRKPKNKNQDNDRLNVNKTNYIENEFLFESIKIGNIKILFLIKNNAILVGTFPKSSSIQFQRLLLIHLFIALINFKGDIITSLKKINEYEEYDKNNFINLKTFYNEKSNALQQELNDILEILIFEYYFLKSLILHFSKVFNEIFKKEDMNLKQTKFKNLYLLDANNLSVILDMCKIQGAKNSKKNKKFYKIEKLFEEITYHSKNLYNQYIRENDMKYSSTGSEFRFVKFECTSTYPRLLFIIKFIPVLKGIAIIHIYSQKKLSRSDENNIQSEQGLNCKEVDLLFGSFIKDNPNFEFKYGAPKKLNYVEKFIEEFYITGRNGFGIFRLTNLEKKYKYVNYYIINIINNYKVSNNINIEQILSDINKIIEKDYEQEQNIKKEKKSEDNESNLNSNKDDDESEMKKLDNLFLLNKESFYNNFFDKKIKNNNRNLIIDKNNINHYNKSLISKDDNDKNEIILINNKENDENNSYNIDKNLNINDIVNSDRKLLTSQNKSLSLYNSKDINNYKNNKCISNNSRYDNFSMISEVKMSEKFEIKVNKKETQTQENKEDTKEIKSSNSSVNKKEFKLNEILDLINSTKKIISFKNKNNKIQEDFEENELTPKDINSSKLSKNSISKKKSKNSINNNNEPDSGTSRNSLINH